MLPSSKFASSSSTSTAARPALATASSGLWQAMQSIGCWFRLPLDEINSFPAISSHSTCNQRMLISNRIPFTHSSHSSCFTLLSALLLIFSLLFTSSGICHALNSNQSGSNIGISFLALPTGKVIAPRSQALILNCTVAVQDDPNASVTYRWTYNSLPVSLHDNRFQFERNASILTVRKLSAKSKNRRRTYGRYSCLATTSFGTVSSPEIIVESTKTPKILRIRSISTSGRVGENFRLSCELNANPEAWYTWLFNGEPLQESHLMYTLKNSSVLHILNASKGNEGQYSCVAKNGLKSWTSNNFTLKFQEAEDDYKSIVFLSPNQTQSVARRSEMVTLECLVNLAYPNATVTWRRLRNKHFVVSNARRHHQFHHQSSPRYKHKRFRIVGESNLQIERLERDDDDVYICNASYRLDEFDISHQTHHKLTVFVEPERITKATSARVQKYVGQPERLDCGQIYAHPRPSVRWLKDGEHLQLNSRFNLTHDKRYLTPPSTGSSNRKHHKSIDSNDFAVHSQLFISNLEQLDSGIYQCIIENDYGTLTSEFRVLVNQTGGQPLPPSGLKVDLLGSRKVTISWDDSLTFDSLDLLGYTVHYLAKGTGELERQEATDRPFVRLDKLRPYTKYSVYARSYSSQGASDPSETVTFETGEERPIEAPFVQLNPLNSTSLLVDWDELNRDEARGRILKYRIDYKQIDQPNIEAIEVGALRSDFIVQNLRPAATYEVRVLAANSKGFPDKDVIDDLDWTTIRMPKPLPKDVQVRFTLQTIQDQEVKLKWNMISSVSDKFDFNSQIASIRLYHLKPNAEKSDLIEITNDQKELLVSKLIEGLHRFDLIVQFKDHQRRITESASIEIIRPDDEDDDLNLIESEHIIKNEILPKQNLTNTTESETNAVHFNNSINLIDQLNETKEIDLKHEIKLNNFTDKLVEITSTVSSLTTFPSSTQSNETESNFNLTKLEEINLIFDNYLESKLNQTLNNFSTTTTSTLDQITKLTTPLDNVTSTTTSILLEDIISNEILSKNITTVNETSLPLPSIDIDFNSVNVTDSSVFESRNDLFNETETKPITIDLNKTVILETNEHNDLLLESGGNKISTNNELEEFTISTMETNTNFDFAKLPNATLIENENSFWNQLESQDEKILKQLNSSNVLKLDENEISKATEENFKVSPETTTSTVPTTLLTSTDSSLAVATTSISPLIEAKATCVCSKNDSNDLLTANIVSKAETSTALPSIDLLQVIYNFEVTALSSESVLCTWRSDLSAKQVLFYVRYNSASMQEADETLFVRTSDQNVTIDRLQAYTVYNFALYFELLQPSEIELDLTSYRSKGFDLGRITVDTSTTMTNNIPQTSSTQIPATDSSTVSLANVNRLYRLVRQTQTLSAPPDRPAEFTGIPLSGSQVQLSWHAPIRCNGPITAYEVMFVAGVNSSQNFDQWNKTRVSGDDQAVLIRDLLPDTQYHFMLRAIGLDHLAPGSVSSQLVLRTLSMANLKNNKNWLLAIFDRALWFESTSNNNNTAFLTRSRPMRLLSALRAELSAVMQQISRPLTFGIILIVVFSICLALVNRLCLCDVKDSHKYGSKRRYNGNNPNETLNASLLNEQGEPNFNHTHDELDQTIDAAPKSFSNEQSSSQTNSANFNNFNLNNNNNDNTQQLQHPDLVPKNNQTQTDTYGQGSNLMSCKSQSISTPVVDSSDETPTNSFNTPTHTTKHLNQSDSCSSSAHSLCTLATPTHSARRLTQLMMMDERRFQSFPHSASRRVSFLSDRQQSNGFDANRIASNRLSTQHRFASFAGIMQQPSTTFTCNIKPDRSQTMNEAHLLPLLLPTNPLLASPNALQNFVERHEEDDEEEEELDHMLPHYRSNRLSNFDSDSYV